VRDQELRSRKREELHRERLDRLEAMVYSQHEKLDRLEDLVYRAMHLDRVEFDGNSESLNHEEEVPTAETDKENDTPHITRKPEVTTNLYPISTI
jgi:hypothetical protein